MRRYSATPRALFCLGVISAFGLTTASAQTYDLEKATRAKAYFSECAGVAEAVDDAALSPAIVTCKTAMNNIAGIFSDYPEHSPMDLNVLSIYSGASAYVVMALDMRLNDNRLSADGCNHAFHVDTMYNALTAGTNEEVEAQLRQNAELVNEQIIPWCRGAYGDQ